MAEGDQPSDILQELFGATPDSSKPSEFPVSLPPTTFHSRTTTIASGAYFYEQNQRGPRHPTYLQNCETPLDKEVEKYFKQCMRPK